MSEIATIVLSSALLSGIGIMVIEYRRLEISREHLRNETERQRFIIEAQERELNQWRREYGTLTNDALWWQEEMGG